MQNQLDYTSSSICTIHRDLYRAGYDLLFKVYIPTFLIVWLRLAFPSNHHFSHILLHITLHQLTMYNREGYLYTH